MLTRSLIAAAAVLTASTALTLPADAKPNTTVRGAVMFWMLDRDNNGEIDKSEVEALRATIFDAVDVNNDGKITQDEFKAAIGTKDRPGEMRGDRQGGPGQGPGQMQQRSERHDGPRGDRFAEGRGPGPRGGDWHGRGPHDDSRGDRYAEGRGPGPRGDDWHGRGPQNGPHGDCHAEGRGHGPRGGEWHGRGPQNGPHGDRFSEGRGPGARGGEWQGHGPQNGPRGDNFAGRGPGPRGDQWQARGPHSGPRGDNFAGRGQERMMDRLGIDAQNGLSKDDFVNATPKLFEQADKDGNGTISQSEFAAVSKQIGQLFIMK